MRPLYEQPYFRRSFVRARLELCQYLSCEVPASLAEASPKWTFIRACELREGIPIQGTYTIRSLRGGAWAWRQCRNPQGDTRRFLVAVNFDEKPTLSLFEQSLAEDAYELFWFECFPPHAFERFKR